MQRRSPRHRRRTGVPDVDLLLDQIFSSNTTPDADIYEEIVATALRLGNDDLDRGDLKIIVGALRELRRTFRMFGACPGRKVTVFGSARCAPDVPQYRMAADFGAAMAARGWSVITGGGPGIMQAANEGAGRASSFGLNIRLPFEQTANPVVHDSDRLLTYRYFFTRKLAFVKEANAFALFPGGFGTMDECFELFTLIQSGKSDMNPIVLLESSGDRYWHRFLEFLRMELLGDGYISDADLQLFRIVETVDDAVEELSGFYRNYHSMRYVEGRLVLRVEQGPNPEQLAELNRDFSDILTEGTIEAGSAHDDEVADGDVVHLDRLSLAFDRMSHGRLRLLIDRLNSWVPITRHETLPERRPQVSEFD